jgi:uncharacterized protein YndB with AHSA1/START domain
MAPIKRLVVGIGLLVLVLVAVAFSLPQYVAVARSVVINAPESDVFVYVNNPKRFIEWSPWAARDPDAKYSFSGPAEGQGAQMTWQSSHPQVGSGRQEIVESRRNALVRVQVEFGDMGEAAAAYQLSPAGAGTRVTWTFETDLGNNPLSRWAGLFMGRSVAVEFDRGLERLKQIAEANR